MQSSIDTVDDTTNEDEQQNCSDIVNNINDVDEHYSIDDTSEVEELTVEETSVQTQWSG